MTKNILNANADVLKIIENISEAYQLIYETGTEDQKNKAAEFLQDFEKVAVETTAD